MKSIARLFVLLMAFRILMAEPIVQLTPVFHLDLPQGTSSHGDYGWDIQHWADGSSYGYAYVHNDSIHYALHSADTPIAWRNDTLFTGYSNVEDYSHIVGVRLIRLPTIDSAFGLIVYAKMEINAGYQDHLIDWLVGVFNLQTNTMIGRLRGAIYSNPDNGSMIRNNIVQLFPFYEPPHIAKQICVVENCTWLVEYPMGESSGTWYSRLVAAPLLTERLDTTRSYSCTHVEPFPDLDSCRYVFNYSYRHVDGYRDGSSEWTIYFLGGTGNLTARTMIADTSIWDLTYFPQQDHDGTRRFIFHGAAGLTALSAATFDTLWHNSSVTSNNFSIARLAGTADERILVYNPIQHIFVIYNATNGDSLGITSSVAGEPVTLIKRNRLDAEVVTYDPSSSRVTVCKSQQAGISNLTLFLDESGSGIKLRWSSVSSATAYEIYAAPVADGPYSRVARVAGDAAFYELAPQESQRFFYITCITDTTQRHLLKLK